MQVLELTTLRIRPFGAEDYDAIARLHTVNFPEFAMTAEDWQFEDRQRPAHCRSGRWVAECDDRVFGFAHYDQHAGHYRPGKFQLDVVVDPDFFLRGIGRRLYDLVLEELRSLDAVSVDAWSREDMAWRIGFFERRGFIEDLRGWTSVLDLTTFDPSRFAHLAPSVEAQGIQIRTLAELGPSDPDVWCKLHEMWSDLRRDVPHPPGDEPVDIALEQFLERHIDRPYLVPAGYLVAVDGEQFVGTSQLWESPESGVLRTGLTGVLRAYRRRGIAFALKIRSLEFGKAAGYRCVRTENESNNRGMLAINDQLGFARNPAWIHYLKSFAD